MRGFFAKNWWKILGIAILIYAIPMAWLGKVSVQTMLHETIRNIYFHVTMWFTMIALFLGSMVYSIMAIKTGKRLYDVKAEQFAHTGMMFGLIGILTGMVWAKFTWNHEVELFTFTGWWANDPKLNGSAVSLLIYVAYFVLRGSLNDPIRRIRVSSAYNIFAFVMLILLIGIMPRVDGSLHPGAGGNPAFSQYDLNDAMKVVFRPAVAGWILIGLWIANVRSRTKLLENKLEEEPF